jgi:hypothetical protein
MDRPPPDPRKLLDEWMEWERGEATPGRVMANLKTAGLRDLLELLAEQARAASGDSAEAEPAPVAADAEADAEVELEEPVAWTPTV